ncbi:hypothetical protein Tco_0675914 [Tanacetum coccineum]
MERFGEAIFKKREEINERMAEMFSLLKELAKGKSPEKVLVREVNNPITRYVNVISLVGMENDKDTKSNEVVDKNIVEPIELVIKRRQWMKKRVMTVLVMKESLKECLSESS